KVGREGEKRIILAAAKLEEYQPTLASNQAFNDFALSSRVLATLLASPNVQGMVLEVRADVGHIHIKGRIQEGMEYEIVRLAQNVPGVFHMTTDLISAPPEGVLRI